MTLILFCAVLGSRGMSISVSAEELNNELGEVFQEEPGKEIIPEEDVPKEAMPEESVSKELDSEETDLEENDLEEEGPEDTVSDGGALDEIEPAAGASEEVILESKRVESLDVCFYIRGAAIGADIPREPALHLGELYSSAIRVNGAFSSDKYSLSTSAVDGSQEALLTDGFTSSNQVSQMLNSLPSADDIKRVVPDFDETRHYVVWYVIKPSLTSRPNSDVFIHVDGVIRERTDISESGEAVTEPDEQVTPVTDPIPEVTLEIRALFLEDGKECKEIEFDGREHIVGGFEIVIKDKESGNPIIGYLYECYGRFIGTKAYADNGQGTEFTYQGQNFWVNVVKAFARVTNPGDSQEVIFYDADDRPLRTAADFIIKDSAGNVLPAKFNVLPTTGKVNVKAKDITIEAGTTVKNNVGQTITDGSFRITSGSLLEGHRIEKVVINGSQTGVGKSVNEISSINIVDEAGNSVNGLYNIKKVNGELILVDATGGKSSDTADGSAQSDSKSVSVLSVTTDKGITATTSSVVINGLEAGNTIGSVPQVLGARRADTSDPGMPSDIRVTLLTVCFLCMTYAFKKRKTYE
jgi:hypothetical protein